MFLNLNCFISEMGRIISQSLIHRVISKESMKCFLPFVKPLFLLDEREDVTRTVHVSPRFKKHYILVHKIKYVFVCNSTLPPEVFVYQLLLGITAKDFKSIL